MKRSLFFGVKSVLTENLERPLAGLCAKKYPSLLSWRSPPCTSGVESVPRGIAYGCVIGWQRLPVGARNAIQVVNNFGVVDGHLAAQFTSTIHPRAVHVGETETS